MPYVHRENSIIVFASAVIQPGYAEEWLPDNDPEVVDFLNPPPTAQPVALCQVAGARLIVDQDNWEVTGVERSTGIAGADLFDVDHVIVFFTEPQMDNLYEVIPSVGVTKHNEFVEVSRPNLTELNFIVQRVQ